MAIFRACAAMGAACFASSFSQDARACHEGSTESCSQEVFMLQTAARVPATEHIGEAIWPLDRVAAMGKRAGYRAAIHILDFGLDKVDAMVNGLANNTETSVHHVEKLINDRAVKESTGFADVDLSDIDREIDRSMSDFISLWTELLNYAHKAKGFGLKNIESALGPGDSELHQHARQHLDELNDDIVRNIEGFMSEVKAAKASLESRHGGISAEERKEAYEQAQGALQRSIESVKGFESVITGSFDLAIKELHRGVDLGIIALAEGEAKVHSGEHARLQSFVSRASSLSKKAQVGPALYLKLVEKALRL